MPPAEIPRTWLFRHLYNPRQDPDRWQSTCPSFPFLFTERVIKGSPSQDAIAIIDDGRKEVVPNEDAKALVSYLLSLKKDQAVPAVLNFAPPKNKG